MYGKNIYQKSSDGNWTLLTGNQGRGFCFCSGQIAIDPKTNEFKPGTIIEETTRVIENLKAVLEQANSELEKTIKVTVYLLNIDNFTEMNKVYEKYFLNKPARSTIEVSKLPKGAKVEIDVIAET